jgi:hypothetical protein
VARYARASLGAKPWRRGEARRSSIPGSQAVGSKLVGKLVRKSSRGGASLSGKRPWGKGPAVENPGIGCPGGFRTLGTIGHNVHTKFYENQTSHLRVVIITCMDDDVIKRDDVITSDDVMIESFLAEDHG